MKKSRQMSRLMKLIFFGLLFLFFPFSNTWAYVGPGVGITMIGGFWVVISIILAAVGGLLVWPIKSLWRWKQGHRDSTQTDNADDA